MVEYLESGDIMRLLHDNRPNDDDEYAAILAYLVRTTNDKSLWMDCQDELSGMSRCEYCGEKKTRVQYNERHWELDNLVDEPVVEYLCPNCDKSILEEWTR